MAITISDKIWKKRISTSATINALLTSRAKMATRLVTIDSGELYATGGITLGLKNKIFKRLVIAIPDKELFVHTTTDAIMLSYDAETDKLKIEQLHTTSVGGDNTFSLREFPDNSPIAIKVEFNIFLIGV